MDSNNTKDTMMAQESETTMQPDHQEPSEQETASAQMQSSCGGFGSWIAAHKAMVGLAAAVLVVVFGVAVALGAGWLPVGGQSDIKTEAPGESDSQAELSGEDMEAIYLYEHNELRGELMGKPLLDAWWASLEAQYSTEELPVETTEETTEETIEETTTEPETTKAPIVVAPVVDKEDAKPEGDADKGESDIVDMEEVLEQEKQEQEKEENDPSYENAGRSYGIDVSKWQGGKIDWAKVASSGVEFAIIRVGYRGNETGAIKMDPYFERNIKGALANGIKVGVYFYSQSIDEAEAVEEAQWVVDVISKYQITYPVVFDYEGIGENRIKDVTKTQRSKNAVAFLNHIRSAGYDPMMYASKNGYKNNWDLSIIKGYKYWLAHYTKGGLSTPSDYTGTYHMWQYTQNGIVPGIDGYVDMNIAYFTYSNEPDPVITTLTYQVTDETGGAVAGATVSMKGEMTRKTLTAVTDENGNAVFQNVVVDAYDVSVSQIPAGYEKVAESSLKIQFGKAEASYSGKLQVKRIKAPTVTYEVVDQEGQAVAGVTVTLQGTALIGSASVEMTAVSDEEGKAVFGDVLAGTYVVKTTKAPSKYQLLDPVKAEEVKITASTAVVGTQKLSVEYTGIEAPSEGETEESTEDESSSAGSTEGTTESTETTEPSSSETEPSSSETEPSSSETEPSSSETEPSSSETEPSSSETEPSSSETEPSSSETEPSSPAERSGDQTEDEGEPEGQESVE